MAVSGRARGAPAGGIAVPEPVNNFAAFIILELDS
jgi:hypothetical protein